MKVHKEVRTLIENRILDKPDITIDEVVNLLKSYAERPDLKLLEERELRSTARRILASFRDGEGMREVFAADDKQHTFVVIERCEDLALLNQVHKQLTKKLRGTKKAVKKVAKRRIIVAGQISMEEMLRGQDSASIGS